MKLSHALVPVLSLAILTQLAAASWNVTYSGLVLFPTIQRTEVFGSGLPGTVWDIEITATVASGSSFGTISLAATGNDSIRHCTVNVYNGSSPTNKYVVLSISIGEGASIPAIEDIKRTTTSTADLRLIVNGLTQFGGYGVDTIHADQVQNFFAYGDILGTIKTNISGGSGALTEQVGTLQCAGDIRGSIECMGSGGQILSVESTGGSIGTSTTAAIIKAYSVVHNVEAYGDIYANIDVGPDPGVSAGNLVRVNATTGGVHGVIRAGKLHYVDATSGVFAAGDLDASFTLSDDIHTPIVVGGDLNGDIACAADLSDAGSWDGCIEIAGDLNGNIALAAGGLQGQIAVNASDASYDWLGNLTIGTTTLGPGESGDNEAPYYGVRSADLGGGAVGLVPFNLHRKDSSPKHGSTVTTGAPTSVQIHHYGSVLDADDDTSTTPPVKVYEASIQVPIGYGQHSTIPVCDTNIWTDVTSGFDIGVSGRVVTISNDTDSFAANHVYQFIPADLVCDVPGSPDVVYVSSWVGTEDCSGMRDTDGYGFRVFGGIEAFDLNNNQVLESGDVATWLGSPVDFDDDGDADTLDLAALVGAVAQGGE